ncbi:hypothetical protein Nepgr_005893 [Nepenthes gracilis]|uniref:Ternary complex factor MIP1, leucine-zipper n=1 Tax=Nepenthes gracilis TaxID=150966 RepID=A0AAD3S407_NEPGR|nr:hypothetical protein Nepgr_005893 [Nepenthes gracilis]
MNAKASARLHSMRAPTKHKKAKVKMQSKIMEASDKLTTSIKRVSSRERKLALQKDVDNLKKQLRHEENVRRALERALTRPLGTLPRLPPYLPPYTLELLAEVAVLEEEVVRLEEQVVLFRQGLYHEAVCLSSSKKNSSELFDPFICPMTSAKRDGPTNLAQAEGKFPVCTSNPHAEDGRGKENLSCTTNSAKNKQRSVILQPKLTPFQGPFIESKATEKRLDPQKLQLECRDDNQEHAVVRTPILQDERKLGDDSPNLISENVLKCLMRIFLRMVRSKSTRVVEGMPALSTLSSCSNLGTEFRDPYGICSEFGKRDIGPYKHLCSIDARSIDPHRTRSSLFLVRRLKVLLGKLATVKLQGLSHQEKLAFWINVYNSCMMNAFVEHGIPETPEAVIALMQKATVNVGGHLLNAIKIEHFILRLPYHCKFTFSKCAKNDEPTGQSVFGLELSEPLVTFALSCGSWSSPAVRVYTASQVDNDLEVAKREYLSAAVGVSTTKKRLAIPKLLDWYLLDFAKDFESLLDWICLQLPIELRKQAINCLDGGKHDSLLHHVEVVPYKFSFRYLLHA